MNREQKIELIQSLCIERLHSHYKYHVKSKAKSSVPDFVMERLMREKYLYLDKTDNDTPDLLLLFHELSVEAKERGEMLWPAGTVANSIYTYLLGEWQLNPLPAHLYCEHCGYFERSYFRFGDDLPESRCPRCDSWFLQEGYSLPEEFAWEKDKRLHFEIRISHTFFDKALSMMREYFARQGRNIVSCWTGLAPEYHPYGVIVLEDGKTESDYDFSEHPTFTDASRNDLTWMTLLRSDTLTTFHNTDAKYLHNLGMKYRSEDTIPPLRWALKGIQHADFPENYRNKLAAFMQTHEWSFRELTDWFLADHATLRGELYKQTTETKYAALKELGMFGREDAFEVMLQHEVSRNEAIEMADALTKDRKKKPQMVPTDMKPLEETVFYLFPRAHAAFEVRLLCTIADMLAVESVYEEEIKEKNSCPQTEDD